MKPLDGIAVLVTRPRHQARELVELLEAAGATAIEFPVIEIVDPLDGGEQLQAAFARLDSYDWLVATSHNTVDRIGPLVHDYRGKIAAIGTGTAAALESHGLEVDLVPPTFVAESLVDAFPAGPGRVLLPRAEVARNVLPEGLRTKAWQVDVVTAYRTLSIAPPEAERSVATADVVTFTASSTVSAYLALGLALPPIVACIGPITAETAAENGLTVDVSASEHTMSGLVDALVDKIERRERR